MCGIAGIVDLNGTREIDRKLVERMTKALAHRGPDGHGYHFEPGVGFGHRRLAIIDIEGGKQPFTSSVGETVVTFNGEIYNHVSLSKELTAEGRHLKTRSDTEVLAELVDIRGADALSDLNGMFAFAAWSPRNATFLLARDRLGEKPLYYHYTNDGFLLFASELDALLAAGWSSEQIDPTAVADYLFYGYVPDPKTIYKDIFKLPAGHCLTVRRGQRPLPPRPWWNLCFALDPQRSFDDAVDDVLPLLDRAVHDQMMSDRPIAAFLSGGIDSSAIISSMRNSDIGEITTCTMGFDDHTSDERAYAQQISALFDTQHEESVAKLDHASLVPAIAAIYNEPFADSSALPTLLLCQMARRHATVALSGDGGDEIFAGYDRYQGVLREARLRRLLPLSARTGLVGPIGQLYPPLHRAPRPLRLRTALQSIGEPQASGYARAVSAVLPDRCHALLDRSMRSYRPQAIVEAAISAAQTDDPVLGAQAADIATWLPGRMLVKVDRASMANGLEVRPPMLDYRLVEWAASLPRTFKVKGPTGKRVLKSALSERLPDDILYRPKKGFGAPIDKWFAGPESPLMKELQTRSHWQDSGYFNVDEVCRTMDRHQTARGQHGQELWSILMFDAFLGRKSSDRDIFRQPALERR
ncbi:MAG: asparagine synthase (glutamine-hydrolyzing) [Pseudomonadota bacterium]